MSRKIFVVIFLCLNVKLLSCEQPKQHILNFLHSEWFSFPEDHHLMPDLFHLDDFNECLYKSNNGRYCFAKIQLYPKNDSSETWGIIEKYSKDPSYYRHDLLRHGLCVSKLCKNENIEECVRNFYNEKYADKGLKNEVLELKCHEKQPSYQFKNDPVMQIFVTCIVATTLLAIFLYKYYNSPNLLHYLTRLSSKKSNGSLSFIEGMRTIGALIVMCGHEPIPYTTYSLNYEYVEWILSMGLMGPGIIGPCVVQIFFFLSSFLMSSQFYKQLEQKKYIRFGEVLKIIASRYLKLTPVYALILYWHCTSLTNLSDGPYWRLILHREKERCVDKWWHHLLYFNNFDHEPCLAHTWTLANEMQFTVVGMLILWLCQNSIKKLFSWSICLIFLEISFIFHYLWSNNYTSLLVVKPEEFYDINFMSLDEWINTCNHTLSNIGSLGIGLFMGWLYNKNLKISADKLEKLCYFVGYPLSFGPLFFLSWYHYTDVLKENALFFAVYGSVMKLFFPLGVACVILPMSQGIGGPILTVLNLRILAILGEYTFVTYLIHLSIYMIYYSTYQTLIYYNAGISNLFLIPLCFVVSFLLTRFVVAPSYIIVKYIFK